MKKIKKSSKKESKQLVGIEAVEMESAKAGTNIALLHCARGIGACRDCWMNVSSCLYSG